MTSLAQDIRYALRRLGRAPGFTAIAILTLALGVGATTAVFGVVDAVLFRDLAGVADPDRLVRVFTQGSSGSLHANSSWADWRDLRAEVGALDGLAAYTDYDRFTLELGESVETAPGGFVSGEYFGILGVRPALGRLLEPADDSPAAPPAAVLSHELWRAGFGADGNVVGRTIRLNGNAFTVVGVADADFRGTSLVDRPAVWVPMAAQHVIGRAGDLLVEEGRGSRFLSLVGRLAPGATTAGAQAEVAAVMERLGQAYPDSNLGVAGAPDAARRGTVVPASRAMFRPDDRPAARRFGLLVLGVVSLVLLIACSNVANLLLARGAARGQEMAVRASLGAGRGRLGRQVLTESLVLATFGGVAGVALALWLGDFLVGAGLASGFGPPVELAAASLDTRVLGFAFGAALLTGVLFGTFPALQAAHGQMADRLREGGRSGLGAAGMQASRALVVAEVALTMMLLVGAGLFTAELRSALGADPGFEPEGALVASVDAGPAGYDGAGTTALAERLVERLAARGDVADASWTRIAPVSPRGSRMTMTVPGYEPAADEDMELSYNIVGPDYFRTLGIPIVAGRPLDERDRAGAPPVAVVNRAFAERFIDGPPVGQRVMFDSDPADYAEIVGVAETATYRALREEPMPYVYLPFAQAPERDFEVVVRAASGDALALAGALRTAVADLDAALPVPAVGTLASRFAEQASGERSAATLVGLLGILALMLAAVGIFGVVSFFASLRTRELGVRMALGSDPRRTLRLVLGGAARMAALGVLIGLVGAALAARTVAGFLHGVSATDPLVYAAAGLVLLLTTLSAAAVPALRAARADPLVSLRE
jgi:predicted permease